MEPNKIKPIKTTTRMKIGKFASPKPTRMVPEIKGRIGFDPDLCNWFESPSGNFRVTDDSEFLFGKGNFPYTEWSKREIAEDQPRYMPSTNRNAVFLVYPNPKIDKIIFFEPANEFNDIWESDLNNLGFETKALDVLSKLKSFGIMTQEPFFVSMDTPLHTKLYTEPNWHKDYFPMIFMPPEFQKDINIAFDKNTLSDYTIIEYTSECTSTAVKIPGTLCDYARFLAQKGTAVCINNTKLFHSSPYPDNSFSEVNRTQGNNRLNPVFNSNCPDIRFLCRTQMKGVSENVANSMIYNDKFNKFTLELSVILKKIKNYEPDDPFETYSLDDYKDPDIRNKMEDGGARKRKKIFKTAKKTKRTKRTKSKTRKR